LDELYDDNITPIQLQDVLQCFKSALEINDLYTTGEGGSQKALPEKTISDYGLEYEFTGPTYKLQGWDQISR